MRMHCLAALTLAAAAFAHAGEVEVLHYWTSEGEAKAAEVVKRAIRERGHQWKDFAVAGGGGDTAMAVLRKRVLAGDPPAAAQIKGPNIQEWARLGALGKLDTLALYEKWDSLLPQVVAAQMKYQGSYVAVPVNVHRVNWMWANPKVLPQAGIDEPPRTWEAFFAAADKIAAAGFVPLAHGGQRWQDFTVFETVLLGVGGPRFYELAMVELSASALGNDTMRKALETFRRLRRYTDAGSPGRDWNVSTAMVMEGRAAFQLMGDWAKGEFLAAGKEPGRDFICVPAPSTAGSFIYNIDSFAMFQLKGVEALRAQAFLASALMSEEFQEKFNLAKGSIPARLNVKLDAFDACAKTSARDFSATAKNGKLVPSAAHGMAMPPAIEDAVKNVVSRYWNDESFTTEMAQRALLDVTRARK